MRSRLLIRTVWTLLLLGLTASLGMAQGPSASGSIQRLVEVGAQAAVNGRLSLRSGSLFSSGERGELAAASPDERAGIANEELYSGAIGRVTDDGALFVQSDKGSGLFRLGGGTPQLLFEAGAPDPLDQSALSFLVSLSSATSADGSSAFPAFRADSFIGIYRLDRDRRLTRLGLGLSQPELVDAINTARQLRDPVRAGQLSAADRLRLTAFVFAVGSYAAPVAVGDGGPIAYIARSAANTPALFQAVGTAPPFGAPGGKELLRLGQAVDGATVWLFDSLASNDAGDLALLVSTGAEPLHMQDAVLRKTSAGLRLVARAGDAVEPGRGAGTTRPLGSIKGKASLVKVYHQPKIGPGGIIVFAGSGSDFGNIFIVRPGRAPGPLLPGVDWFVESVDPGASTNRVSRRVPDYAFAPDSSIAIRAARVNEAEASLYLISPAREVSLVAQGRPDFQPVGPVAFGPDGQLFFLAETRALPPDRYGLYHPGLFRFRPGGAGVEPVALPGDEVPGRSGQRLLGISERPAVGARFVAFTGLFAGSESSPIPTAGLFRVPAGGTLKEGVLVAADGEELDRLSEANRIVNLRDLTATADRQTLLQGLLTGGGPIVVPLSSPTATASGVRTQAAAPAPTRPLLAIGQPLDRPDRTLREIEGRIVPLGVDRQLFAAKFSQAAGAGEGLFTVDRNGQVRPVAVTGEAVSGLPGSRFADFAADGRNLNLLSVSPDGNVMFKARLDRSGANSRQPPVAGLFQWLDGAAPTAVALSDVALIPNDLLPHGLDHWAAGKSQRSYVMERSQTPAGAPVARLFERSPAGVKLLVSERTPPLSDLLDFVLSGDGSVYVQGATANGLGVFRVEGDRLTALIKEGDAIPPFANGGRPRGVFDRDFRLLPDSAAGALLFQAGVKGDASQPARQGLFRLGASGTVETFMVEGLGVAGSRDLTIDSLAPSAARQTVNGTTAYGAFSRGHWQIVRTRVTTDARGTVTATTTVVAAEGQKLSADGRQITSLNPGPVVGLPDDNGPVFALNDAGDVAFLAADGKNWGIYRFSDRE